MAQKSGNGRPKKRTPELTEEVREVIGETLGVSIHHLSQQLDLSVVGTCNTILRSSFPFIFLLSSSVYELRSTNFPERIQYCQWFLNTLDRDDPSQKNVFLVMKHNFTLVANVNLQNKNLDF